MGGGGIASYPGNYEDFLRKKEQEGDASHSALRVEQGAVKETARPADKQERVQSHEERKRARRAEQKRQRDLQDVETRIEEREAQLAELEQAMADPELYNDRARWQEASGSFEKLQDEIAELYQRWEKLQLEETG